MNNQSTKVSLEYWLSGVISTLFAAALTITAMQQIRLISWRFAENEQTGLAITLFLIICAVGALNIWLLADKKRASIGLPALALALGSVFVIPYGRVSLGMNAVNTVIACANGQSADLDEVACYVVAAILGYFISIGIFIANRNLVTRCITAVITFATLMVLVFTDSTFNVFCLMLMFAYICYVLLQFCAARSDKQLAAQQGQSKRGRYGSTYVPVCLITALIAALIPSSPDPIPWGEIGQRIRDALTIDDVLISTSDDPASILISESKLYIDNEELAMVVSPVVVDLTDTLSDVENHAVGSIFDTFDGRAWSTSGVQTGALSDDPIELAYFLSRVEAEDLSFLDLKK
ncbi:MAG: hypothetical protein IJC18_00250, partial [Clostridia bacterium]|nr:hypothetical protein [Clostridia bacterium]